MDSTRGGSRWLVACALVVAALVAVGCGGGGADPAPPAAVCGDGLVAPSAGETCDDGNVAPGDGCAPTCGVEAGYGCTGSPSVCTLAPPAGVTVTECRTLAALPAGTCQVVAGGAWLLVEGTLLLPGQVLRGGQVAVNAAGLITCVGCDCTAQAAGATRVSCPRGVVSPGLINAHDHLTYAQAAPHASSEERYEQRHDWRRGQRGHTQLPAISTSATAEVQWGELRQLLSGTTAVLGSGGTAGLLRNLDRPTLREGLAGAAAMLDTFPLGDTGGLQLQSGCAYPAIVTPASLAGAPAAHLHVAEGIDATAHNELACLTGAAGGQDLALPAVAFVASAAALPQDWALLASRGTGLVWSPRSNVALYGDTARVTEAARLGVMIGLGTDWAITGSATLGRELACADQWNRERLGGFFSDEQLWLMATRNGADLAGLLDQVGLLAPGRQADLVVFDGSVHRDFRAVLDATPADVALVLRAGRPLSGEVAVVPALGGVDCEPLDVCGVPRRACLASELGTTFAALQAANAGRPSPFACGAPAGEPTCTPARTGPAASVNGSSVYSGLASVADGDGDGLPDAADRCPTVFDPIRPLDGGVQPDADGDGVGDACDPCPLLAGITTCPAPDPADLDGDGITTAVDDCPLVANPDQVDTDADGTGDLCDLCPLAPNPGGAPCP